MKLFVQGRQSTFSILENQIDKDDKTIWMHAASLGEYEQGLPLLEQLKKTYPNYKLVLSFFSPSGYEVKKDNTPADVVVYLPMDTMENAKRFVDLLKPDLVIFIKYEIWPNFLKELKKQKIHTLLVSAIFSKRQFYFKPHGGFMRGVLKNLNHFFVQDQNSRKLLKSINFENVSISGDTRFDRVFQILMNDNKLDFMESFKGKFRCLVAGSTWPEDETLLINYINQNTENMKFVIAPHNIKPSHIQKLKSSINKSVALYSESEKIDFKNAQVLIVDTIGLLTKIYSYAEIAYVGGGFATGLHNTLEPAVFGIPVIIGPKYDGFKEAKDLVKLKGVISISNKNELQNELYKLTQDDEHYQETGKINSAYINEKQGATKRVMSYINELL